MKNIRNDFNWFKHNSDWVYLDSAATSLKPIDVVLSTKEYYEYDCTNPHNTDSTFSYKTKIIVDKTRELLSRYINCDNPNSIIFTPSATFSLNMIAHSLINYINSGDEIVITNAEHASNILPWYDIKNKCNAKIVYANSVIEEPSLDHDILNKINSKTKIVSFANGTNLIGTKIDAENLSKKIKIINPNVIIIVDATQYLSHSKMDVNNSEIDFIVGSAHKMFGPTGIGFIYSNIKWINELNPLIVGGGMNHSIKRDVYTYVDGPEKFEAGTINVAGIYGWNASLKYLLNLDLEWQRNRVYDLKKYLDDKLSKIDGICVHNKNINSMITIFSFKGVFSQDLASFLGTKKIIVRSGLSCAKLAHEIIDVEHVIRVSMHFYTTKEDLDKLINVLENYKRGDEINVFL